MSNKLIITNTLFSVWQDHACLTDGKELLYISAGDTNRQAICTFKNLKTLITTQLKIEFKYSPDITLYAKMHPDTLFYYGTYTISQEDFFYLKCKAI